MDFGLVTTLLGVIIGSLIAQTTAVWVKFSSLEKKMEKNKCPFGECPLYTRAREEAVAEREIKS